MRQLGLLLILSLLLKLAAHAQGEMPKDLYRMVREFAIVIVDGKPTPQKVILSHYFTNKAKQKILEKYYDVVEGGGNEQINYFYTGDTLVRKEFYIRDTLRRREVYMYFPDGKIQETLIYRIQDSIPTLACKISYDYNPAGQLVQERGVGPDGEQIYRINFKYDKSGHNLFTRMRTKGRNPFAYSWVKQIKRSDLVYDSIGNLLQKDEQVKYANGEKSREFVEYAYDDLGRVRLQRRYQKANGPLIDSMRIRYFANSDKLFRKQRFNHAGELIEEIQYMRDIYPNGLNKPPTPDFEL